MMSKEEKKYPNWNRICGFLGNGTYGIYDAETAEKIKLKGQEVLKELLEQTKPKTKMSKEVCQHNGKYTLNKDNKCCKCRLPLKKSIKGIRLPIKPKQSE